MQLIDILLQVTIFLIMISVGSSVVLDDIRKIFKKPKKIIIGLILQILVLPIIAIIIAIFASIPVYYKIGIVILAACPGGAMSNFISYLTRADVTLSIALTSINSFITMITIPLYATLSFFIFMGNGVSIDLPVIPIISKVLLIVILPTMIGMFLRYKFEDMTLKLRIPFKVVSTVLLLLIFLVKFFGAPELGGSNIGLEAMLLLFPYLLILNIAGLFVGYFVSKKISTSKRTAATMGIEVGLQNTVLALLVADVILKNPAIGHPALVYAMFSFIVTFLFALFTMKNRSLDISKMHY